MHLLPADNILYALHNGEKCIHLLMMMMMMMIIQAAV
jgi:hypothetical protein